jgi:glycerophosphoryl diester phosphodiesterase
VALVTEHTLMDKGLIERIHRAGQRALVYTVNDEEQAQKLLALGIDGLITDAIDRFAPGGGHTQA